MTKIDSLFETCLNCISDFWRIATMKKNFYEYVIEDIQLQERNNIISSQVYYRAIGSRTIMYDSASELNTSDIFSKFSHVQAQAIVTLSTIEKMMQLDKEILISNYKGYAEQCAKIFRSQRKK